MAAVTALGESLDALWPRLLAGESAIAPVTRFDASRLEARTAACVAGLERGAHPNLTCALMARCLDQLGKLPRETLVIWAGVKGDAEWVEEELRSAECGVRNDGELRSAECGVRNDGELRIADCGLRNESHSQPTTHNSQLTTHNSQPFSPIQYRKWICTRLGTSGAGMELNAACASSSAGLALGAMMIARGQAGAVLVCAADLVTRFTFTGFAALRGLTPAVCRPLDAGRDGLALGDGAAAMLLMSDDAMRESGAAPLARLAGWGLANDATHITAPARDGCGLIAAIRQALQVRSAECGARNEEGEVRSAECGARNEEGEVRSAECGARNEEGEVRSAEQSLQVRSAECGARNEEGEVRNNPQSEIRNPQSIIGAWCVHGTGTVYNDAMELTALETVFGDRRFPIFSIKGAVGHTLGAAGALEAAVCVKALKEGIVPPTAGLANPEPRAAGRAEAHAQPFNGSSMLTTNSGFGGVNAALIIESAPR